MTGMNKFAYEGLTSKVKRNVRGLLFVVWALQLSLENKLE
jgi:hypothetical protein